MSGYDPGHFAALFAVEDRHFWFGARNAALATVIEQIVPSLPRRYRVLEIGCGTGNTLRMLKKACAGADLIVGMDLFAEGLRYAQQRSGLPLVQARIEHAPFLEPFDLIGMFDVLEHIDDDAGTLARVRGMLRPGGGLVVSVPAHMALWSRFDEESHHCRRYEPGELGDRLTHAGFSIEYLTPFMASLYPVVRLARWLQGRAREVRRRLESAETSAVLTDLKVWPGLNEAVGFVLRREVAVLRRRGRLPIGTSLLAVCRAR